MVRALILFGTGPGYRNPTGREGWNQTAFARAKSIEERGLREGSKHRSAAGLAKAARGMLAQFDGRVIESLPNITVPTLVLVGAKDEAFLASSEYMAAKIPGAQAVVIPDAGHGANSDQPAAFNAAVVEFLSGLPG